MKVIGKRYNDELVMFDVQTVNLVNDKIYVNLFMVKGITYKALTITNAI